MSRHVVVIGAGAAGTAAAFAAARAGARVTVVGARPGATSLGSGAVDGATSRAFDDDGARVSSFFEAFGLWEIGNDPAIVATSAGLLRETRGRDRAVLDLSRLGAGPVAVVDARRGGFDAQSLARAWCSDPYARERRLEFHPARVDVLRFADESWFPDGDLAARHDDAERVHWLAERLRAIPGLEHQRAVMLGPWLGLRTNVAAQLSAALTIPVGEPLSLPGGVAGQRFELARDALFASSGIEQVQIRARAVRTAAGEPAVVELESGAVQADAVVLAIGGLAGGGALFAPDQSDNGFAISLDCAASFAMRGELLAPSGSPRGPLFEPFAWSGTNAPCGFERVGLWTLADGRARDRHGLAIANLYVAGDAASDRPRTLLEAVRAGISVGRAAASAAG